MKFSGFGMSVDCWNMHFANWAVGIRMQAVLFWGSFWREVVSTHSFIMVNSKKESGMGRRLALNGSRMK